VATSVGSPRFIPARRATATNKALAGAYAANVLPVIREIRRAGATLQQIAKTFTKRPRYCYASRRTMVREVSQQRADTAYSGAVAIDGGTARH
jgi:hypothetical protein